MTHSRQVLLLFCALGPQVLAAQAARKSQPARVMQMLGMTEVAIAYNRPSARGRKLFGALVPWGKVWCPGADEATTIAFNRDVVVGGQPLAAGKYSLWAIPERDQWTVIFSRATDVFHVPYPGEAQDALRIKVTPVTGSFVETLVYYFSAAEADRGVLDLQWGETIVPIPIAAK